MERRDTGRIGRGPATQRGRILAKLGVVQVAFGITLISSEVHRSHVRVGAGLHVTVGCALACLHRGWTRTRSDALGAQPVGKGEAGAEAAAEVGELQI